MSREGGFGEIKVVIREMRGKLRERSVIESKGVVLGNSGWGFLVEMVWLGYILKFSLSFKRIVIRVKV